MNQPSLVRVRRPCIIYCLLALSVPCCSAGTEGDNPFVGPVDASPCKGEAEYATYLARAALPADGNLGRDYAALGEALVARDEMPIGLECLEWEYARERLRLAVSNFAGGCSIDWEGEVTVPTPGEVVIALRNPSCDVARCGSCLYDTSAEVALPLEAWAAAGSDEARVTLELHDCKGELGQRFERDIALDAGGISCRPGEAWSWVYADVSESTVFSEAQRNLYAPCGETEGAVECTEERTCNSGYCVPACSSDAECPLDGALTCQEGACLVKR